MIISFQWDRKESNVVVPAPAIKRKSNGTIDAELASSSLYYSSIISNARKIAPKVA
jgi:hypothetical protein